MKKHFYFFVTLGFLLCLNAIVDAKDYKAAIIQTPTNDIYPVLIKAIAQETNNTIAIEIVPSARAIDLLENKQVELLCPATENNILKKVADMKYEFSSVSLFKSPFVLYSNKNKKIDIETLKKGNPQKYQIETTPSLADLFEFESMLSFNVEASFKKVNTGMIDGFIYPQGAGDPVVKRLELKNIKRQLYNQLNVVFGIQKGAKGGEVDKMLTNGIQKLKENGKLDKIIETLLKSSKYDDWQP
jgi:polar amino acid transport system substrate-binding protein